jgi:neutral ceramidase
MPTVRRWLWCAAFLLCWTLSPAAAGELRAGVARVDITPPVGTPLGGYGDRKGAPSTGIHDPIHAKALVLDDGATRLAIVTTDLVGTNPEMVRRVAQTAGFPREQLMVCATHTHSGPGAYGKGLFATIALGAYREAVFTHLADGMARALKEAAGSLQPAKLAIGEAQLPDFMRNRRKAKIKDPALWLMRVDAVDGKPLAALVNLTAHGTVLGEENLQFSGDWMAFTQELMEREVPGLVALYANGAEGDISPNIPDNSSTFDGARAHGERGGKAALELYRSLKPQREAKLSHKTTELELPKTLKSALIGAGKTTMLQIFTVNDALLIGVPGEMITQLGLALKEHARRQGHRLPVIMGLANDHLGYLLTRAEMKKGGYEAGVSFFGDDFGEDLTLAIAGLIGGDTAPVKEALSAPPQ